MEANRIPNRSGSSNQKQSLDAIVDAIGGSTGKSFKPTSTQQLVFNNITKGTCASGAVFESPQQWAEDLQCLSSLGVVLSPSLCKGMYSFELGRPNIKLKIEILINKTRPDLIDRMKRPDV